MTASSYFTRRPERTWFQRHFLWIATLLIWLFVTAIGVAWSHDPYSTWKIPGTDSSCCSLQDCAPAEWRIGKNGYEAYMVDKWVEIPEDRILRDYHSPDGQGHLCARKDGTILCFAPGIGS